MRIKAALLGSVSILFPVSALAAEAKMPAVVVTANRTEMPADQIASTMTIINREQIERRNALSVLDMLREVPGLSVAQNGGQGQTASLFMRGTNSNHVLVMVDGMWVNDPSAPTGAVDFSNLLNENIERIEIVRGPQSAVYGSSAVGGVINIITRQGKGKPEFGAFAEYGTYHTRRGGVSARGEVGRTSYSVSGSSMDTGGISSINRRGNGVERDGSENRAFSGNITSRVTEAFTAKLNTRYARVNTDFDNFSSDSLVLSNLTSQWNTRAAGNVKLLGGKWEQELSVQTFDAERNIVGSSSGFQHINADRRMADWVHHLRFVPNHVVTLGAEWWEESFKSLVLRKRQVSNRALFADDQVNFSEAWFAGFSARLDDHETFGRELTYKIAPGYRIKSTDTLLKASYGTAFRAPTLVQLYDPTSGNTNLSPESSKGYEFGFEQAVQGDNAKFGASFFRNEIKQLFGFISTAPYTTINEQRARTQGVESFFTLNAIDKLTLNFTHTYTQSDNVSTDKELVRRPRHQVNAAASYAATPDWNIGANLYFSGSRRDFNFSGNVITLDQFYRLDFSTTYRVMPGWTLYGKLENALDEKYEETFAYSRPGRTITVGAKVSY